MPKMEKRLFVGGIAAGQIIRVDSRMREVAMEAVERPPFAGVRYVGPETPLVPSDIRHMCYRKAVLTIPAMVPDGTTDKEAIATLIEAYKGSKANDR